MEAGRAVTRSAPYDRLAVENHRYAARTPAPLSRQVDRTTSPPSVIENRRHPRNESHETPGWLQPTISMTDKSLHLEHPRSLEARNHNAQYQRALGAEIVA